MKYAIFGGSFDPPHLGHLGVAQAVKAHLGLDEVVFVPNNQNPLRGKSRASAKDRLEMVKLMVSEEAGLSVSDAEVLRPGRSFMVDTVEEFNFVNPGEMWLVLGTDALKGLLEWRNPEKIVKFCRLAVVTRPGNALDKVIGQMPDWVRDRVDEVPMRANRASSTEIRTLISTGESPEMWLDPDVWKYISERGLYRKEA